MQLQSNTLLQEGKYRIERVLGQGGFGITYLATHTFFEKKVAIKEFFYKDYCEREESTSRVSMGTQSNHELVERFLQKFIKEARTISKLDHPHIVHIQDIFKENNTAYYVMDYIEGESLSDRVKRQGALPESEAISYIKQVASALDFIHKQSINHLDVKPANIMVRKADDRVILIDFGLSKQYDEQGGQTSSTPVGISHGYAPMEQYNVGGVSTFTPQTDIYSLGATLYKLVTGQTPPQAIEMFNEGFPTMPSHISVGTITAIEKAMQPSKKLRPANVAAFLALLTDEEEVTVIVEPVKPKPIPKPEPIPPPHPVPAPTPTSALWKKWAVPLAMCVVAALAVVLWPQKDEKDKVVKEEVSTGTINGHKYIDLGLSVKWADRNVGANSPSDYGSYFAWGETRAKGEYTEENSVTYEKALGDISGNSQYDAARVNWGSSWRLPTRAECEELVDKCQWDWTTQGGHNGHKVTGPNGNSIFLPAAGYRSGSSLYGAGEYGYYWSSAPSEGNTQRAYGLLSGHYMNWEYRCIGRSVRPVSE